MLVDQLTRVRRNPTLVLIALVGGLVLGVLIGVLLDHHDGGLRRLAPSAQASVADSSSRPVTAASSGRSTASRRSALSPAPAGSNGAAGVRMNNRDTLRAALSQGVEAAEELHGEAAAAVWIDGDSHPILSGDALVPHRLWSMSKAVVSVAALQVTHDQPDAVLQSALSDAIRRSDNCAIRRVIVGLQDQLGRGTAGTVAAFGQVLATAGARMERTPQSAPAEQACVRYLDSHRGDLPGSDLGTVPEFGTAEWTERDAISFAHALSDGAYRAEGAYLVSLMGLPKQPPLEEPPPPLAPKLDWGAGAVFPAAWRPAWKAGWGGSQNDPPHFLAGQIVVLHLARVPVAVAAIFVPRSEPATDNPGLTQAPRALELMFEAARAGLEDEHVGGVG